MLCHILLGSNRFLIDKQVLDRESECGVKSIAITASQRRLVVHVVLHSADGSFDRIFYDDWWSYMLVRKQ
ncbi:hypothetical protein AKJ16_DCAP19107 [Drosera capensis]